MINFKKLWYHIKRISLKIFIGAIIASIIFAFWWLTGYNFDERNTAVGIGAFISILFYLFVYVCLTDELKLNMDYNTYQKRYGKKDKI